MSLKLARKLITGNTYVSDDVSGVFPMQTYTGSVPSGYEDISTLTNWDLYYDNAGESYRDCRNMFITDDLPNWDTTVTEPEKKILIKNFVYPSGLSQSVIDSHWTTDEQADNILDTMAKLKLPTQLVVKSKSVGSDKYFNITVDDTGVSDPQEIKSYEVI